MAVIPWLSNYPFSDPIFQNFEVQQYLTVSGVNPAQTYDIVAPNGIVDKGLAEALAAKQQAQFAAEAKAAADKAEAAKLDEARKLVAAADAKAPARKTASKDAK